MYMCKIKNEDFENFIYLNGGWVYYEKCPICNMIKKSDGSNHKEFWDNHIEDDYEFNYDLEEMQKRIDSAAKHSVRVPKELKTTEEFLEWMLNYDTTKFEETINLSRSVEGVEITGDTKEERIKHMKQIFKR